MCSYRYKFSSQDWLSAARHLGSDVSKEPINHAAQCFLPGDDRHDDMPHLLVNPWTGAVHAVFEDGAAGGAQ